MRLAAVLSVGWVVAVGGCVTPAAAPPAKPWDGFYTGDVIATPVGSSICPNRWPKRDTVVVDNYVNFGEFQGPINPDGSVVLTAGNDQIYGRFTVGQFTGDLANPPPGCIYRAVLTRT